MRSDPAAVFAPLPLPQPDAMPNNNSALRQLWLSAPPGRMSPWQQARALALREVSEVHLTISSFRAIYEAHPFLSSFRDVFAKLEFQ